MEALGLCEKIYGFIAQPPQGPGQETQLGTSSSAIPEQSLHGANEPAHAPQIASRLSSDESAVTTCSTHPHQIQPADEGKGVLLDLVGEKVDAYNLRGVEAGMDLLVMGDAYGAGTNDRGKVLHTKKRRQQRVCKGPYERTTVRGGRKGESNSCDKKR